MPRRDFLPYLFTGILLLVPLALENPYALHMLILVLLWTLLGQSWNLLGGFTGQVSFGHAAFFGTGAYTAGIIVKTTGNTALAWTGLFLGGLAACLLAAAVGWICFRLRGPYFSLSVLALAEVLRLVALNWKALTNGAEGILFIPAITGKAPYFYIILALAALNYFIVAAVMKGKLGFYFLAIREDQDAAESLGIPTARYKLISLLISAFFTGAGGAFYMNYMGFIDPSIVFSIEQISVMMILVTMLGGAATLTGPAAGAAIYILASEAMRVWVKSGHLVFFGILIITIIIFFPNGIAGTLGQWKAARRPGPRGGPS